jgi:hypothetical protein
MTQIFCVSPFGQRHGNGFCFVLGEAPSFRKFPSRKSMDFKHFLSYNVHYEQKEKRDGGKQVVDIPIPFLPRPSLFSTLIYFGTANKVQSGMFASFSLFPPSVVAHTSLQNPSQS